MKIQKSEQVKKLQLQNPKAIVALESTVYSCLGLPLPERQQALDESKKIIEDSGACPAVTAVLEGQIYLGLSQAQEEKILMSENVKKMSLWDMPVAQAEGWEVGVTTVSAGLAIAAKAGAKVMATGGIGGVHREQKGRRGAGGETIGDVSADLYALSRYPVGLVSAGAKGFLDLPKTLEMLESLGVAVVGYKTDSFPAFWCQTSGLEIPHRIENTEQGASLVSNLTETGALIAAPVPADEALENSYIEKAVKTAIKKAQKAGATGAASTPYILQEINLATNGKSLTANLALLKNNVGIAAQIAVQLGN